MNFDIIWMEKAYALAKKAEAAHEVPVGAVLINANNEMIGQGYNQTITSADPTAHAEINAIRQAADTIKNYRLVNTTLYVTLEPCIMCLGAMVHARIQRLVFGAADPKIHTTECISNLKGLNHRMIVEGGCIEDRCKEILQRFFEKRR